MFRSLTNRQLTTDIVVAVVVFVVTGPGSYFPLPFLTGALSQGFQWPSFAVSFIICVALAIRRLSPALSLGVAWLGAIIHMICGLPPMVVEFAIFGVLYAVARYAPPRIRRLGLVSIVLGSTLIAAYLVVGPLITGQARWNNSADAWNLIFVISVTWAASAFGLGLSYALGALGRANDDAREQSKRQEITEALAAAELERARIARDMHDVVAHSLAVVIAQADGARYAAASQPEVAGEALQTIGQTARSALADVRLLLTQLRHSQAAGPQPTLADLEELYAQVRGAGIELRVDVSPAPRSEVPGAVQLAVYRILQEALTNAIRHGDGSPVDVSLAWRDTEVEVGVRNAIHLREVRAPGGHGLIGMRERASLVGGTLEAAPLGDVFVVKAIIPVTVAASTGE